jgi:hypothetical protein
MPQREPSHAVERPSRRRALGAVLSGRSYFFHGRVSDTVPKSGRACAGLDLPPDLLTLGELLRLFGRRSAKARAACHAFVAAGTLDMFKCAR